MRQFRTCFLASVAILVASIGVFFQVRPVEAAPGTVQAGASAAAQQKQRQAVNPSSPQKPKPPAPPVGQGKNCGAPHPITRHVACH